MRRLERTVGMRRSRGRWAIMATHKGVVGTASGNQAATLVSFIIWALMLLAGTTTEKSYTASRAATERKTVPSPIRPSSVCSARDGPNEQELLT